jgi:ferritin
MLSKTLLAELNEQINKELYSAYLYLAMSAHFEEVNLGGFAKWMKIQAGEEQEHALKFYEYVHDRGGKVEFKAIDAAPASFGKPLEIFKQVLEHEQFVSARINKLYAQAVKDNDYAAQVFLNWFVNEQVEEEKNATEIIGWLEMVGESPNGLFQVNGLMYRRAE